MSHSSSRGAEGQTGTQNCVMRDSDISNTNNHVTTTTSVTTTIMTSISGRIVLTAACVASVLLPVVSCRWRACIHQAHACTFSKLATVITTHQLQTSNMTWHCTLSSAVTASCSAEQQQQLRMQYALQHICSHAYKQQDSPLRCEPYCGHWISLLLSTFSIANCIITPDAGFEDILSQRPFNAPAACPCTAEALCTAPDLAPFFDQQCNVPRHGSRTYSMHGGAGKLPFLACHA